MSPSSSVKRIVVLVSGSGSNLQAIIDECEAGHINGHVVGVISNVPNVYALERAKQHNTPSVMLNHRDFASRELFDAELAKHITQFSADLIVLAGFMRILSSTFVGLFTGKMLNIHPSLLPKYPGLHTHTKVLENNDTTHGASVHFVNAELDGGPVVIQSIIKVTGDDTINSLPRRIAITEWQIYPLAVKWFCNDTLRLGHNGVWFEQNLDFTLRAISDAVDYEVIIHNKGIQNDKDNH